MSVWRQEEWRAVKIQVVSPDRQTVEGAVHLTYGKKRPTRPLPEQKVSAGFTGIEVVPCNGSFIPVPNSVRSRSYYWIRCINGQRFWFLSMLSSIAMYVIFSLAGRRVYNLDRLLHRREYQSDEDALKFKNPVCGWRALFGVTAEFTRSDRIIYFAVMIWSYGWVFIHMALIVINLIEVKSDDFWIGYFKYQLYIFLVLGVATAIWYGTGAVKDAIELCRKLASQARDESDDGRVEHKPES